MFKYKYPIILLIKYRFVIYEKSEFILFLFVSDQTKKPLRVCSIILKPLSRLIKSTKKEADYITCHSIN